MTKQPGRPLIEVLFEETFAARLFRLRIEAGLTVPELARAAGLPRVTVYQLERGKRKPLLETAERLARALGKTIAVFASSKRSAHA